MRISLRSDAKIYINGAVLRVDRKVNIELLNEAVFLLENHVLQPDEADTPLKQIYFVIQSVLIEPKSRTEMQPVILSLLRALLSRSASGAERENIPLIIEEVKADKYFLALKHLRKMFEDAPVAQPVRAPVLASVKEGRA
ncbi:MAG: flagellar biosynthesis repressor FlbT [Hyphomicrobiales bacterium]|nr:flagellar biosynthesis repressor FlbT [Hyphomicrobiales bacterium]